MRVIPFSRPLRHSNKCWPQAYDNVNLKIDDNLGGHHSSTFEILFVSFGGFVRDLKNNGLGISNELIVSRSFKFLFGKKLSICPLQISARLLTLKLEDCIHGTRQSMKDARSSQSVGFSGLPKQSMMSCPTESFFLVSVVDRLAQKSSILMELDFVFPLSISRTRIF